MFTIVALRSTRQGFEYLARASPPCSSIFSRLLKPSKVRTFISLPWKKERISCGVASLIIDGWSQPCAMRANSNESKDTKKAICHFNFACSIIVIVIFNSHSETPPVRRKNSA